MSLESITQEFTQIFGKAPSIGKTIKLDLKEGIVFVDLTGDTPTVNNDDKAADVVIKTSVKTLRGMRDGSVNPMMAMMTGQLKIKGDMNVAMQIQSFL